MALSTAQIKKALRKRGWTYERVGQLVDPPIGTSTIYKNVNKVPGCVSRRARYAIATALDTSIEAVYGEAA